MNTDIDDATFVQQMKNRLSQYIDVQYEQNLMKDVNVIGYLIEVLELMVKRRVDTFETAFQEYVQTKFHSDGTINRKMKSFVTVLFFSYIKQANKSNDLTYIKRYVYTRRSNNSIQFYIKLRKLIITSFSQNSRSQMLDDLIIKFGILQNYLDDWSTLTTRFLGAHHISSIGSKVKQENAKTRVYDKILTNSIDAVTFVSLCVDIFESDKNNSAHKKQQVEQHQEQTKPNNEEEQEQEKDDLSNKGDEENQDDDQVDEKESSQTQQELQKTSIKSNQQKEQQQQQQQQQTNSQQLSSQLSSPQKKLLSQLQETKYQLLDEKMRQSIAISKTIKCYEHLTDDYHHLMKHSKDQMQFIIYLVNKLKNRSQLSDQDFNKITDFTQFHYLTQDPKEQLMKTGAYDFAK